MSRAPIAGAKRAAFPTGESRIPRGFGPLLVIVCAASATAPRSGGMPPAASPPGWADVRWRGDFETGNLGQWSYLLNPRGLSVVQAPVAEGRYAARIELQPGDLWPNGLNRVELEHKPAPETVAEGRETYLGWRFLVPAALSPARHQIGYWESYPSYRQIMAFEARGTALAFVTRLPAERVHWTSPGAVTPNVWHRIVMRVAWSVDPAKGFVDVWYDGAKVVEHGPARTLWDNPNFVHVGLLRDAPEATETMFIDAAVEGTSLAAVLSPSPAVVGALKPITTPEPSGLPGPIAAPAITR